jgi:hypothetical protein
MNLNAVDRLTRSEEAYLDVTKNKTGTIREQIRQELNLTASAGVAPNKFFAKIASDWRKPDRLFMIQPDEADAFLCLFRSDARLELVWPTPERFRDGFPAYGAA